MKYEELIARKRSGYEILNWSKSDSPRCASFNHNGVKFTFLIYLFGQTALLDDERTGGVAIDKKGNKIFYLPKPKNHVFGKALSEERIAEIKKKCEECFLLIKKGMIEMS